MVILMKINTFCTPQTETIILKGYNGDMTTCMSMNDVEILKMDIRGNNSKCLPLIWLENLAAESFRNNYQATVENLYAQWKMKEFSMASYLSHSFKGAEEGSWIEGIKPSNWGQYSGVLITENRKSENSLIISRLIWHWYLNRQEEHYRKKLQANIPQEY